MQLVPSAKSCLALLISVEDKSKSEVMNEQHLPSPLLPLLLFFFFSPHFFACQRSFHHTICKPLRQHCCRNRLWFTDYNLPLTDFSFVTMYVYILFYLIDPHSSSSFYCAVMSGWHCDLIVGSMRKSCRFSDIIFVLLYFYTCARCKKIHLENPSCEIKYF